MTDLQVKYQLALETERANRAREELQAREAAVSEREAAVKELEAELKRAKLPAETQKLISEAELNQSQKEKLAQEVINLKEEIDLIRARTDLTQAQKETEMEKAFQLRRDNWKQDTGYQYVEDLLESLIGGFGKAASKALIG